MATAYIYVWRLLIWWLLKTFEIVRRAILIKEGAAPGPGDLQETAYWDAVFHGESDGRKDSIGVTSCAVKGWAAFQVP